MSQYEALFTSSIPDSPGNPWRVQRSRLQTDQPRHNPWHSDLHSSGSVTTMAASQPLNTSKSKFHFLNVWPCIIITIVLVGDKENGLVDKHRVHFRTFFRIKTIWDNICNYIHTNTHIRYSCVNFQCSTALHSGDEWKAEVFLLNQLSLGWLNKSSWEGFRLISRLCWSRGLTKTNRLYSRQRMFIPFRLLPIMLLCVSRFSWHLLSLLLQVSWKHPRFCEHEWWLWNIPVFTTVIMYPAAKHEQIALNTPHRF